MILFFFTLTVLLTSNAMILANTKEDNEFKVVRILAFANTGFLLVLFIYAVFASI